MNDNKTIFGEENPGIGPATNGPVPMPTRCALKDLGAVPVYMASSTGAYMAPSVPDGTNPWKPAPYVPFVPIPSPSPYIFPTPDVFGDAMKELQTLGLRATDALRLLAICDWECKRALEITKACRKDGIWDILQFARELMNK